MLLVMGVTAYRERVLSNDSERWVEHTHQVLENLQDLQLDVETAKSSYREFALTGDEPALVPFRASEMSALQHIKTLRELTADNASQQRRMGDIARIAFQRIQIAETLVDLRRMKGVEAVANVVRSKPYQKTINELSNIIREAQAEELRLLGVRETDAAKRLRQTKASLVALTAFALFIVVGAGADLQRESVRRTSTEQLLDNQEASAALLDLTSDAIFVRDLHNEILFWNKSAECLYGWNQNEVLGKDIHELLHTVFPAPLAEIDAEVAQKGYWEGELRHKRSDGRLLTVSSRWAVQRDSSGRGVATLESNRDVSQRRQEDKQFQDLMEAAPDAMVVVNQAGQIVLLNLQAERKFGFSRDELLGEQVKRIIPEGFAERLIADGTRTATEALLQQMGAGIELSGRRKDGTEFPIEIMLSPLESVEGILVTAAIRDITVRKAADANLVQVEDRYRGLLEAAPDAMVVVDSVGQIVLLNVQAERKFGYSRDELLGQQVSRIIPEGFAERLIADGTRTAAEALLQQIGTGIELSGLRKDGSKFPLEIMLSPLESAEGILVTAAIRDITVRKAADAHLVQMEGRYRGLLEAAPDAMVVVNQDGEIVLLNLQAERKFGYSRDELLGQEVTRIIPEGFAERLIADGTRTATEALRQQMGAGIELSGRRKDGSRFPIEIMLSPLTGAEGILVTAAIRDITVRKAADESFRQSEERLSMVLTNVMDYAILILDLDGCVVSWNEGAERIKGYRAEEIIGKNYSCFYPAESIQSGVPALHLELARRNGRFEDEGWRVHKDGSEYYANVVITALRDKTGLLRGFGKIVRDITARVTADERRAKAAGDLKRSNDQLMQFAYVASHDLQEPLRMVASYTQLLAKRYKGRLDSDADEFIGFAVDGCNRMQGLIRDLLAYSRAGADKKAPQTISMDTALNEALVSLRISIKDSGAIVTRDSLPTLTTDETQMVQVFQNLIGNAIKYRGREVPLVHVSAVDAGKEWIFSVRDNGLGIAPEYFERVFVIFQRLHGKGEFEGTGIGLAICKKNVEQLGGRIWVESELGNGSTFYFALQRNEGV